MRKKTTRQVFANKRTPLDEMTGVRNILIFVFAISGVVNVLALTGSFYMLQIYDRALTSQSIPTLLALSGLAIGLYLIQGMLDVSRSQILVRLGARFDQKLAPLAHQVVIDMPRFGFSTAEANERGRDVDTLRSFLGGQGPMALFDLPWMPLYLVFVYALHPMLGLLTIAGAVTLTFLTLIAEVLTKKHSAAAQKAGVARAAISTATRAMPMSFAPWASPRAPSPALKRSTPNIWHCRPRPTTWPARSAASPRCCA